MTARQAARHSDACARAILRLVFCACAAASASTAADPPREVHGVADAYVVPGMALAWGILRGTDEASTRVVIRIVADPQVYAAVSAIGKNPFSDRQRTLLPSTPTAGAVDVLAPRPQYADFPRTDWFKMVESRKSAKANGSERRDRIVSIDFSGPGTAFAKVECQIPPRYFTDYLTLLKVDGRWQVISKSFHTVTKDQ